MVHLQFNQGNEGLPCVSYLFYLSIITSLLFPCALRLWTANKNDSNMSSDSHSLYRHAKLLGTLRDVTTKWAVHEDIMPSSFFMNATLRWNQFLFNGRVLSKIVHRILFCMAQHLFSLWFILMVCFLSLWLHIFVSVGQRVYYLQSFYI